MNFKSHNLAFYTVLCILCLLWLLGYNPAQKQNAQQIQKQQISLQIEEHMGMHIADFLGKGNVSIA
jgi:hypothetical protein